MDWPFWIKLVVTLAGFVGAFVAWHKDHKGVAGISVLIGAVFAVLLVIAEKVESPDVHSQIVIMTDDSLNIKEICTNKRFEEKVRERAQLMADSMNKDEIHRLEDELAQCRGTYADSSVTPYELGVLAMSEDRYKDAADLFKVVLASDTISEQIRANASFMIGLCNHYLENYEEAILNYKLCLTLRPNAFVAWNNIGVSLQRMRSLSGWENSIAYFDSALSYDSLYINAHWGKVWAHRTLSNLDLAIASLDDILMIDPENEQAETFRRGLLLEKIHGPARAGPLEPGEHVYWAIPPKGPEVPTWGGNPWNKTWYEYTRRVHYYPN
jgi:tetratricopeptide (TPR) repeat protein